MKPIPNYGDLITLKEFSKSVETGLFIDYDGIGYFSTLEKCDEAIIISPSIWATTQTPAWATHVLWFNR